MRRERLNVLVGELPVECEAEMSRLDRDVRPQALAADAVERALVLLHHRPRLRRLADSLAEQRRVREQTAAVELPQHRHRLLERLTGDEATRSEAHAVPANEAADRLALGGGEDQPPRERVDDVRDQRFWLACASAECCSKPCFTTSCFTAFTSSSRPTGWE